MVVAVIGVVIGLTGTAFGAAALGKNSVGSRQLKAKSVTTGKLADNAVNGAKVAAGSLTGADINVGALGTVPTASVAARAGDAATLGGHSAACPAATTLIRGLCFDSVANPSLPTQAAAAEACAAKGGWLPSATDLYAVRGILNLGTGVGDEHQYTDIVYANTAGSDYSTVVVDGTGAITEQGITEPSRYTCVYPLVR
jgi:hypothetical protein